ncbi:MAG TPA: class I SAM-dependent methyltransferase [Gaiellaceae bacterium]|nr:class I SAM-dependent methyltransferase [Gaiellaceae bacterium]
MARDFYDDFAADYHLAYGGRWDEAVERQGRALAELLPDARNVLDCSCGIGTQAVGLALRSYRVTGSDRSTGAIERARREAARLGADVRFDVADFRDLSTIAGEFDAVISCDNALPHLLAPADVVTALEQMRSKLRAGGKLVVTMRDFDRALEERPPVAHTVRVGDRVLVRLHEWEGDQYTVRYLVLDEADGWRVTEHRTRYRAIPRAELEAAAREAGFAASTWLDHPVVGDQLTFVATA